MLEFKQLFTFFEVRCYIRELLSKNNTDRLVTEILYIFKYVKIEHWFKGTIISSVRPRAYPRVEHLKGTTSKLRPYPPTLDLAGKACHGQTLGRITNILKLQLSGNTATGSIIVLLTSCLTGLESAV